MEISGLKDEFELSREAKLEPCWSPEQIAGWLGENFPDDPEMRVSHETIYLSLFVQSKGALRKELTRFLADRPRQPATARPLGDERPGPAARHGQHQRTPG
jgi:IS30 family transposase